MDIFRLLMLVTLVICAIAVSLTKNLLSSIIVYMAYSLVMSVIWILLESPTWPSLRLRWGQASLPSCFLSH